MMPTPCFARSRMISNSALTSRSEMEEVGSSITSMRQLKEMALTISTICCWGDAQIGDQGIGVDAQIKAVEHLLGVGAHLGLG